MHEPLDENPVAIQPWRKRFAKGFGAFVDFVTPPRCHVCGERVASDAGLCLSCWSQLKLISEPVCDALGTPFEYDEGEGMLSVEAIADPPLWDKARAVVSYDEQGRKLVHALKYRDQLRVAPVMARMMLGAGKRLLAEADVIVPVPLHRRRLWQRRFNQAAVLALALGKLADKPVASELLLRLKATRQQVGLDADERRKNVARAFVVEPDAKARIEGKTVLLVDDVRTTGATAGACAATLKKAGAAHVHVLTFALVLAPYRPHIEA